MSSTETVVEGDRPKISCKNMWARHVAETTLKYDFESLKELLMNTLPDLGVTDKDDFGEIADKTEQITGRGYVPEEPGKIKVGIVGAGISGLFTALLFDWLNDHPNLQGQGLSIDYDIFEAAGVKRLGGRLYTHHFSTEEHDYYDVGAMRFPNNFVMTRTFQLFQYIGITPNTTPGLIPYYINDEDSVCPSRFNDVNHVGNVWTQGANDPFDINSTLPPKGKIPQALLQTDPGQLVSQALSGFINTARDHFDRAILERQQGINHGPRATDLWSLLMKADHMSVRQFLGSGQQWERDMWNALHPNGAGPLPGEFPLGPGYNFNTIEWLETSTYGTGWYNQALTEIILEELDFNTANVPGVPSWWCIDGGAQEIAKKMASKINKRIDYNTRVDAIDAQASLRGDPNQYTPMKIRTTRTDPETKITEDSKEREYFAIFNSTTLGALQRMDTCDAGLSWGTKQAIRALGYGASAKVGMKFKTAWWQKHPFNIKKGGLSRTDLPLRVCVYPSYNIEANEGEKHDPEKSAVLLCSYTWGQDAQRIGSLCSKNTPENEEELRKTLFHDLARLHANAHCPFEHCLQLLKDQYVDHHAWDWYSDQNMSGAFAYFGPGQFSNMWQEIIKPNAYGQLYLVGEAASSHHAWIVGALESVIRATYVMFQGLQRHNPGFQAYEIVLGLLRDAPPANVGGPGAVGVPVQNGAMPEGLPFHPLPDEMPEELSPSAPVNQGQMPFGVKMALLGLIQAYADSLRQVVVNA
ncbi:hypothetical protein FPOA_00109 [Fusarium poae]|uniref:Amine oxidase domain-containing protein n=1 Tax=Fusarium poae TaxID=36050 RepID=A0A1B8B0A7_FUSPO|nr:hypothetical protein FPOA_00109 [Fusarium poae]